MRETKTGFGAKGQHYQQEGGLEPDDEDSDEDEGEDDDQDIGDDGEEDDDESDHNFWVRACVSWKLRNDTKRLTLM